MSRRLAQSFCACVGRMVESGIVVQIRVPTMAWHSMPWHARASQRMPEHAQACLGMPGLRSNYIGRNTLHSVSLFLENRFGHRCSTSATAVLHRCPNRFSGKNEIIFRVGTCPDLLMLLQRRKIDPASIKSNLATREQVTT